MNFAASGYIHVYSNSHFCSIRKMIPWLLFVFWGSTTGHARELCGEGSKANEFYSSTDSSASWRTFEWFYLVFPALSHHASFLLFCVVLCTVSDADCAPGDLDAHNGPVGFLAPALGGGRRPQCGGAKSTVSCRHPGGAGRVHTFLLPHHPPGLFLNFRSEWINPIHRLTYNRAFILPVDLSFWWFVSAILTTEFFLPSCCKWYCFLFLQMGKELKIRFTLRCLNSSNKDSWK